MKISKILPVAALGIALSVGATQKAEAYAYAYSDLQVKDGVITITNGFVSLAPASTSTATAALGGSGTSTNDAGALADTAVAIGTGSTWPDGSAPTNNSWTLEGASAGHKYSWADSQIISEQNAIGSKIATRQIAEGNTTDPTLGSSGADTSSVTEVTFSTGLGGGTFNFNFEAALSMLAEITLPHTGTQALATARIEIQIRDDATDAIVFSWLAGNAGGTGVSGAATNAFSFTDVSVASTGSSTSINAFGTFDVTSVLLAEGKYNLSLNATVTERVQANAVPIPSPGVLTLFGSGLVLLGFARRRDNSAAKMAA